MSAHEVKARPIPGGLTLISTFYMEGECWEERYTVTGAQGQVLARYEHGQDWYGRDYESGNWESIVRYSADILTIKRAML